MAAPASSRLPRGRVAADVTAGLLFSGSRVGSVARSSAPADPSGAVGPGGLNPFQLLGAALDRMVAAGAMPAARRQGAEFLAWAGVHGLALLMIEGPLRGVPEKHAEALGQQLLDMIEKGL